MLRGKLVGLAAVVLAITVVTATGAFTTVTAERTADVDVAGDANAYLGLEPHQNSPNGAGAYAVTEGGELALQLNGDAASGSGVNLDATTEIDRVFNVTNQGTQPVGVWLTDSQSRVSFYTESGGVLDGQSNASAISPGETLQVGISVDSTGVSAGTQLLENVTVHADASEA